MDNVTHYPVIVFVLSFLVLWFAARTGWFLMRKKPILDDDLREDFGRILAGMLTLLALLIGFSFSMAISRYDLRKTYEEAEANAIGTEYVRVDSLPATDAANIRALLRSYLEQRVLFYLAHTEHEFQQINVRTAQLQKELWSAVRAPAEEHPTPVVALTVAGMNDVLNSRACPRLPIGTESRPRPGLFSSRWPSAPASSSAMVREALRLDPNCFLFYLLAPRSRSCSSQTWMLRVTALFASDHKTWTVSRNL